MRSFTAPIPLALYVHIPWCVRKCPYCDFNSHKAPAKLPERAYIAALLADLEQDLPRVWGRRLESVFIGGGTPSLFSAESIERLLAGLRARLPLRPDMEVTLEANPGTVEQSKFREFREAGVNRLSIGVQSFRDEHLQRLGRIHDKHEAIRAAEIAHSAGFANFNLDLMYGLPKQTPEQALADVEQAIALDPTHISYYQLTLEPGTVFFKQPPRLPDDEHIWTMQLHGQDRLAESGYCQYEISAYARDGRRCRHNLNYWEFGDYLGIGAGAHAKLSDYADDHVSRQWKQKNPRDYLGSAGKANCIAGRVALSEADLGFEFMLNALRLRDGFPSGLFTERTGLPLEFLENALTIAEERGLLFRDETQVRATERGRRFLNDLLELFLPENTAEHA